MFEIVMGIDDFLIQLVKYCILIARVVVAPLDAIIGILAIRHFLAISEESLPEQVTIVLEKSTLCCNP